MFLLKVIQFAVGSICTYVVCSERDVGSLSVRTKGTGCMLGWSGQAPAAQST